MSWLFGGGKKSDVKPDYTDIAINTSIATLPVPLLWGRAASGINLLWYGNFRAIAHSSKAGGKGGSSKTVTSYTYQTGLILGICAGPINGFGNVWKGKDQYGSPGALGLTAFLGSSSQTAWSWLSSFSPSQALNYRYTAYLASASFDLGSSDSLPNLKVETFGALYGTGINSRGDADIPLVAQDYLIGIHGVGLPGSCIDGASWFSGANAQTTGDASWQTYCRALGLDFSPCLDSVEKANDVLARWFQITNTAAVWSGAVLKAIPYGDAPISGNGYVFTPNTTPIYDLTDSDFVRPTDGDPVQLVRSDPNDAYNCYRLQFADCTVLYNANIVEARDQASIEQFGLRVGSQVSAHEFTQRSVAQVAANLICQRSVNIRNTYTFRLSWEYFLLEPMDLVTLTDPGMGLAKVAVRITSIEEDEEGILTIVAEEFPSGTATATAYPAQTNSNGLTINPAAVPAPVNPPVIFEPAATLTGGVAQVWIAASGGTSGVADPNWGGCNVWLSVDGTDYEMVGSINGPARMGVLTAALPSSSGTNPDNAHTLAVDLTESAGTLSSGSAADAAAYRTLCWCDGELLAFETATLTAIGKYNLTTLYRGLYGTVARSHAVGAQFARLDQAVFQYNLPQAYVGQAIFLKLQSFNVWGGGVQDLSTCTAYSYTPQGTGFPLLSSAGTYGGITVNAAGQITAVTSAVGTNPYDIGGYVPGLLTAGQALFRIEMVRSVTLPAWLTGSRAACQTAPTNAVTLPLKQNGTAIGSIAFAAGATVGSFTLPNQITLAPGDILELDAPSPADNTFAGPSYTIAGTR